MTAPEMSLDQVLQISRLQAEELEMQGKQIRHILKIFDEREQRLLDGINTVRNDRVTSVLSSRLEELKYIRKEIDIILGAEG